MGMFSILSKTAGFPTVLLGAQMAFNTYSFSGEAPHSGNSIPESKPTILDTEAAKKLAVAELKKSPLRLENCSVEAEIPVPFRRVMMDLLKVGLSRESQEAFLKKIIEQEDTTITAFSEGKIVISKAAFYRDELIKFSFELKEDRQIERNKLVLRYYSDVPIQVGNRFTMLNFETLLRIEPHADKPEITKVMSSGSCELSFHNSRRASGGKLSIKELTTQRVSLSLVAKDLKDGAAQRLERFEQQFSADNLARKSSILQVFTLQKEVNLAPD